MNSPALALTGETLRRRCNVRAKKKRSGDGGIMIMMLLQVLQACVEIDDFQSNSKRCCCSLSKYHWRAAAGQASYF